ncbi:hypothetical protein HDU91_000316 [Kappamyces sp. JEL0680]|nr:hypothetical protein HDU91_000316 [Kappamyces sp. JEL0680]
MKITRFSPHLGLPLATFVNLQSITVPLVHRIEVDVGLRRTDDKRSTVVLVLSVFSLISGIFGVVALTLRMLEKKIKWSTRLAMLGSFLQGILCILAVVLFHFIEKKNDEKYTEAIVYKLIAGSASLVAGSLALFNYLQSLKEHQNWYVWVDPDLSNDQRQFIILTIVSMTYMSLFSTLYSVLENWAFDKSLYWCISTFLTIGFGDLTPKSALGLVVFPPLSFIGILLMGSNIYAMRNLFLEVLAVKLASQYSQFLIVHNKEVQPDEASNRPEPRLFPAPPPPIDFAKLPGTRIATSPTSGSPLSGRLELGVSLDSSASMFLQPPTATKAARRKSPKQSPQHHEEDEPVFPRFPTHHTVGPSVLARDRRKMTISRSKRLPSVTILANETLKEQHIIKATQEAIIRQMVYSLVVVVANVFLSAVIFAYFEDWSFGEGLYFSYCAFMTIGYGDYVLRNYVSRSIFIWYIFLAVGSSTYLFSMLSELAIDKWTVTTETIAKRVDRYETKAKWKQQYGSPSFSPQISPNIVPISIKGKEKVLDDQLLGPPAQDWVQEQQPKTSGALAKDIAAGMEREQQPRAYAISIARSEDAVAIGPLFKRTGSAGSQDEALEPLLRPVEDE